MTSMAEGARPWRCFWAVPLPDNLRSALAAYVTELRLAPGVEDEWRFTGPGSWHLTLSFLGGVEADALEPMIARVAAALEGHVPIELRLGGVGGFPSGSHARVLWYGVGADADLQALAGTVRAATGTEDDQPFNPHVTLARSRDSRGARLPVVDGVPPSAVLPVSEVDLFRSHLGRGPARYEALARLPLRALTPAVAAP